MAFSQWRLVGFFLGGGGGSNFQILGVVKTNLGATPKRLLLLNLTSWGQKAVIRLKLLRNKDIKYISSILQYFILNFIN